MIALKPVFIYFFFLIPFPVFSQAEEEIISEPKNFCIEVNAGNSSFFYVRSDAQNGKTHSLQGLNVSGSILMKNQYYKSSFNISSMFIYKNAPFNYLDLSYSFGLNAAFFAKKPSVYLGPYISAVTMKNEYQPTSKNFLPFRLRYGIDFYYKNFHVDFSSMRTKIYPESFFDNGGYGYYIKQRVFTLSIGYLFPLFKIR